MPLAAKPVHIIGVTGKEESVYGTAVTLSTAEDGMRIWPTDRDGLHPSFRYLHDGDLGPAINNLGRNRRGPPQGQSISITLRTFFQGAGATYSTVIVSSLHKWLKMAGLDAVFSAGPPAKWTYTPGMETAPTSLTMDLYSRGERYPLRGVLADWSYEAAGAGWIGHEFTLFGIASDPVDSAQAVAAGIVYPLASVHPLGAAGMTVAIGSYVTPEVKRVAFRLHRSVDNSRTDLTAADAHAGFQPRGFDPLLEITIAATAFVGSPFHTAAGLDLVKLIRAANNFAVTVTHPGAATHRWVHTFPTVQVIAEPMLTQENGVACWTLRCKPYANDWTFVTD